jgi:hypothetical protein
MDLLKQPLQPAAANDDPEVQQKKIDIDKIAETISLRRSKAEKNKQDKREVARQKVIDYIHATLADLESGKGGSQCRITLSDLDFNPDFCREIVYEEAERLCTTKHFVDVYGNFDVMTLEIVSRHERRMRICLAWWCSCFAIVVFCLIMYARHKL